MVVKMMVYTPLLNMALVTVVVLLFAPKYPKKIAITATREH